MKLVVIGASAGGFEPITSVLKGLPADLNAAVIVIRHMTAAADDLLTPLLDRQTPLKVEPALDAIPLHAGYVYVAQPNTQVRFRVVANASHSVWNIALAVSTADTAHRSVPTIDVTLAAAAPLFRSDTIAVILSGRLDDGTDGAIRLADYGGTTIVQRPLDARYKSMPLNVISRDTPEHIVPTDDIPILVLEHCGRRASA